MRWQVAENCVGARRMCAAPSIKRTAGRRKAYAGDGGDAGISGGGCDHGPGGGDRIRPGSHRRGPDQKTDEGIKRQTGGRGKALAAGFHQNRPLRNLYYSVKNSHIFCRILHFCVFLQRKTMGKRSCFRGYEYGIIAIYKMLNHTTEFARGLRHRMRRMLFEGGRL